MCMYKTAPPMEHGWWSLCMGENVADGEGRGWLRQISQLELRKVVKLQMQEKNVKLGAWEISVNKKTQNFYEKTLELEELQIREVAYKDSVASNLCLMTNIVTQKHSISVLPDNFC